MRHLGGTYTEPEHATVDFVDTWGRCGQSGGDSAPRQPGFIPYSLRLEPELEGGLSPVILRDVDNTILDTGDCIAESTSVAVFDRTCGALRPSSLLRRLSPYKTMVSFTKEVASPCKGYFLTRVGEKSAHVYLAVLLLR
jgi:hypothetical protein